jgi:hypothetical protein
VEVELPGAAVFLYDHPNAFRVAGDTFQTRSNARLPGGGTLVWQSPAQWTATLCSSCERVAVWREDVLIYPRVAVDVPAAHPDMPQKAGDLYREAAEVLPISRRAAAALARASMESLLKELAPTTGKPNLQTRIAHLKDRINPRLWRVLTALRVVGNDALHDEDDELIVMYLEGEVADIVEPFFGAINQLVEELITQPKQADALYDLIPSTKREAAERPPKT